MFRHNRNAGRNIMNQNAKPPQKCRILIVDNDHEFTRINKDFLEEHGYTVLTANDGAGGLELAIREKPDLMLLDVMTAENTEGFAISRKIPQTPELRNMPVIMVTGIRHTMNLPFRLEPDETWLPVDSVLEKPIAPVKLWEEIRKRLNNCAS